MHIANCLRYPPADNRYEGIKKLLNNMFGDSRHMGDLGDRKRAVLMNKTLVLLEGHKSWLLFEHVFLEQIPDDIRLILVDDDFSNLWQLATLVDELWQATQQSEIVTNNVPASDRRTPRTASAHVD